MTEAVRIELIRSATEILTNSVGSIEVGDGIADLAASFLEEEFKLAMSCMREIEEQRKAAAEAAKEPPLKSSDVVSYKNQIYKVGEVGKKSLTLYVESVNIAGVKETINCGTVPIADVRRI